jgi:hypothetical protein
VSPRAVAIALCLLALPAGAATRDVEVPLQLDHPFLRQMLLTQVYTQADNTARVWDDGSGCNFMVLSNPRTNAAGNRLRVVSDGVARVGTAVGSKCLNVIDWSGTVRCSSAELDAKDRSSASASSIRISTARTARSRSPAPSGTG